MLVDKGGVGYWGASAMAYAGAAFAITSGTYGMVAGSTQIILNLANRKELIEKIPSGYLNATVGLVVTATVDNKEVQFYTTGVLDLAEGAITFKIPKENKT